MAAILLVVGATTAWVCVWLSRDSSSGGDDNRITLIDERTIAQRQAHDALGSVVGESDPALIEGPRVELERLLSEAQSDEDRVTYLSSLVVLHQNAKDYDRALGYAMRLEELAETDLSAAAVAGVYYGMENFAEAARFYQIAADRSEPTDDPKKDTAYNDHMNSKREAEARI